MTIVLLYRLWVEAVSLQLQVLALSERLPLLLAPPSLPAPAAGLLPEAFQTPGRPGVWAPAGDDWLRAYA